MGPLSKLSVIFAISCCIISASGSCVDSVTTASGSKAPSKICSGDLIFNEQFNFLDFKTWKHDNTLSGGGNWEFQWYTNNRSNSYVRDGTLYLKPTLTSDTIGEQGLYKSTIEVDGGDDASRCTSSRTWGCLRTGDAKHVVNPIKSAKVTTQRSFAFKYGKMEVRAKLPRGDWLWPAIWMLPVDDVYGYWVASGEIDLMESRGNKDLKLNGNSIGSNAFGSTLHWGPDGSFNRYEMTHFTKVNPTEGYDDNFHNYQLLWTPDKITFSVDGTVVGTVAPKTTFWDLGKFPPGVNNPWKYATKMAPFDEEFYIILNLAVGGTAYFPDAAVNPTPKPWSNGSPAAATDFWKGKNDWLPSWNLDKNNGESAALQVDYIKVYAL